MLCMIDIYGRFIFKRNGGGMDKGFKEGRRGEIVVRM